MSVIAQLDDTFDALTTYFSGLAQYLGAPTSNPPVQAVDVLDGLDVSEVLVAAQNSYRGVPSMGVAALTYVVDTASSIQRDINLRNKTRAAYYAEGVSGHTEDSAYYDAAKILKHAALGNRLPTQTSTT